MIDLHTHSTFSDGSYTPEQLVEKCAAAELTAVALTDHDTVAGIPRFMAACQSAGIRGIEGVEISADVDKGGMHMLGYCVDTESESLEEVLVKIREGRSIRNVQILKNLNSAGLELSYEEVEAFAGENLVGRPHFAQAMQARGYVKSKTEAFGEYLARGKKGYADRFRLSPEDSIAAIRNAGGVPVLAHPFTLRLAGEELEEFIAELASFGLEGIEVYYSEHSPKQVKTYRELAQSNGLLLTGGSDFHGEINPAVRPGAGFGNLKINDDIAEKLFERKGELRADLTKK